MVRSVLRRTPVLRVIALLAFGLGCGPVALVPEDAGVVVEDAGSSDGGERFDAGEFRTSSRDEIGVLTEAMGRMKASLVQAMKMLES